MSTEEKCLLLFTLRIELFPGRGFLRDPLTRELFWDLKIVFPWVPGKWENTTAETSSTTARTKYNRLRPVGLRPSFPTHQQGSHPQIGTMGSTVGYGVFSRGTHYLVYLVTSALSSNKKLLMLPTPLRGQGVVGWTYGWISDGLPGLYGKTAYHIWLLHFWM